ncbi:MAG TPA: hypothetical protein VGP41_04780 [Candidatus Lustribacter sp.]|nr:hypothetical protein [Candidatus Lustribacter sp.]
MSVGAVSPGSTAPLYSYVTSSTAPYQASPTNSTASSLPLTQTLSDGTDRTFTASTTDHELNVVTTPNPFGTLGQAPATQPDTLAQSGIGLHVSSSQ